MSKLSTYNAELSLKEKLLWFMLRRPWYRDISSEKHYCINCWRNMKLTMQHLYILVPRIKTNDNPRILFQSTITSIIHRLKIILAKSTNLVPMKIDNRLMVLNIHSLLSKLQIDISLYWLTATLFLLQFQSVRYWKSVIFVNIFHFQIII